MRTHGWLVAMHRALGASGFIRLERAALDAAQGVSAQGFTFRAQIPFRLVFGAAVNPEHPGDGLLFLQDSLIAVGGLGSGHPPIVHR